MLSSSAARFSRSPPAPRRGGRGGHADFYASLLPAMIPVALLGSAVYMGLHLLQSRLAHEKFLDDARVRIHALEQQVHVLQNQRSSQPPASHSVPASKSSPWWP